MQCRKYFSWCQKLWLRYESRISPNLLPRCCPDLYLLEGGNKYLHTFQLTKSQLRISTPSWHIVSFWTSKASLYFCIEPGTEEIFREERNTLQLIQLFLLLTHCVPIKDLVNTSQLYNFPYKVHKIDCPTQLVVQNVFEIIWWKVKLKKKELVLLAVMLQLVHYPS